MPYETSYDAGLKPFNHDKQRGKWTSPMDFFFACILHAFKLDSMLVLPSIMFRELGICGLIPYLIVMVVCVIPIVFIQSFLGQFSSTGFISVFRVAPLFKGIGYVSLALNVTTLTFYSLFAAIPFFYFIHSLKPTLPWGCEGKDEWAEETDVFNLHCNKSHVHELNPGQFVQVKLPSVNFLIQHLNVSQWDPNSLPDVTYSWSLILCTTFIWIIVWAVLRNSTEMIGKFIRYSTVAVLVILGICFLRFMFLPGAFNGSISFIKPVSFTRRHVELIIGAPLMALSSLGPGWGSIISMASYNEFKTDTTKYSWIVCLGQFGLMILTSYSLIFIEQFLTSPSYSLYTHIGESQLMQFLAIPTALSFLEMPNFWCLIYFGMLTLGATNLLIVQLFSVLTSVFDEFDQLRRFRKEVILTAVVVIAFGSFSFCSNYGIFDLELIANYSILTQMLLNLLLLIVVVWVYGRERFQRDLEFMTSRTYYTWMVYIVRFIAPIVLLGSLLIGTAIVLYANRSTVAIFIIVTIIILLPWFMIPGYCIFKMMQTSGMLRMRFKRCVRPTDWYPADPVDRQRYEETFENTEISHQLTTTITEDNV